MHMCSAEAEKVSPQDMFAAVIDNVVSCNCGIRVFDASISRTAYAIPEIFCLCMDGPRTAQSIGVSSASRKCRLCWFTGGRPIEEFEDVPESVFKDDTRIDIAQIAHIKQTLDAIDDVRIVSFSIHYCGASS